MHRTPSSNNSHDSLIAKALRREVVERPPVWMMRQAGRYLPEYMELRKKYGFLERCYNPQLAAEITLQPLRRFSFDAGIIFSDILLPLHAMGADLHFREGEGPEIDNPIRSSADVQKITEFEPWEHLPAPMEAIQLCTEETDKPILGFAGAPFTLACYWIEGKGSRDWAKTKAFMWNDPENFKLLLDKLAVAVAKHLRAQLDAGAIAVQLFDTWAGALSREEYAEFALPAVQKIFSLLPGENTLYFCKDSSCFVDMFPQTNAKAFALDWRADWNRVKSIVKDAPLQGNLDPIALQAPTDTIVKKVRHILMQAGPVGHIFNLGHGCTPQTPISGIQTVLDTVQEWNWLQQ